MVFEMNHKVKETKCKQCNHLIDGAVGEGEPPKKGDFSVCGYCSSIGRYTEEGEVNPMSEGALEIMKEHDPATYNSLQRVVLMIKKLSNDKS
jgi:hypothetical protein